MSRFYEAVRDFDITMNCRMGWEAKELRAKIIQEEAKEIIDAVRAGDPIEAIDGLCDLLYVAYGASHVLGVPISDREAYAQPPANPPMGLGVFLIDDFVEVVGEAVTSILAEDKKGTADKLSILVEGCWLAATQGLGIDLRPFFDEVHRTNMLKAGGPVREDGKKLKPPGWKPPRIADMYAQLKRTGTTECTCDGDSEAEKHPNGGHYCAKCGGFLIWSP